MNEAPAPAISPESVGRFKTAAEEFSQYAARVDQILADRADERLAELIPEDDIGVMRTAARELTETEIKKPEDIEAITQALSRMASVAESIGDIRPRNVTDDQESLEQVSQALLMMLDTVGGVHGALKEMGTAQATEAAEQIERLTGNVERSRVVIARKREALENM